MEKTSFWVWGKGELTGKEPVRIPLRVGVLERERRRRRRETIIIIFLVKIRYLYFIGTA
jgi:hypothetical protein